MMNHFRLLAALCLATLLVHPASAERLLGRSVLITDGRSDPATIAPLVVAMHGFLGTGQNMRKKTGLDRLARQYGFVVAYPNGRRRMWNDGRSVGNRVDDVAYLTSLMRKLVAERGINPRRIFLAGHSNGGGMAMRMACDMPELVAGIAVVATKSPLKFQCASGPPIPAFFVHGTDDPISPHAGRSGASRLGGALSSAATIDIWQKRNRCRGQGRTQMIDAVQDGTAAKITQFSGCSAPLVYVEIEGHGHDWPQRNGQTTRLQGTASKEIDASAVIWRFFSGLK